MCANGVSHPFVPAYGFSHRNQSIVGVLQPNHLKPARNKQDFQWSQDLEALQKILKEMGREFWRQRKGKELKDAASQLSLAPAGSHDEANLIGNNTNVMPSQTTPSAPTHLAATIVQSSSRGMPSDMVPKAPAPCLPLFPTTPAGDKQKRVKGMADAWDQCNIFNGVPPRRPTTLPFGWNSGTSSHGIGSTPTPHLSISAIASMAGDGHWQTTPAVARTNVYGMNINGTSTFTAPWPAYLVPPFSQPNSSVGSNGAMRVPAPHLAAVYTPATLAGSLTGSALPLPETQVASASNRGSLAPSHSVQAGAMVAPRDVPIKMDHDGAYDDIAILLSVGLTAPTEGTEATSATAAPELTMIDTRHSGASAFHPWCPPGFKSVDGSSSSRQAQELQGDSNQGEQGAKPLLDLFKP
ncbi:hypothetical protein HU200_024082 [Digitaria exilis]|uniref:Morc S5 domain-containing protein n=1 Tax=Digitaria exilis TaxID=1010633 RepID=A0A835EY23_9POAL|nr:hypothetical protein HU200_024082 [Digitaria exilis]